MTSLFNFTAETPSDIGTRVVNLSRWFDSMRGGDGYGGPIVHWWANSFQFTGAGLDWRYEGIILGYLTLYQKTGDDIWLQKAQQAGDDLIRGELPGSAYRNSSFELNPYPGGTPHEAACDLALLHLAETLRSRENPDWNTYQAAAERNLRACHIQRLWDEQARAFRDDPNVPSFVPNKAATLVEALFKLQEQAGAEDLVGKYIIPTLNTLMAHQITDGKFKGAIFQYSAYGRCKRWFFPLYIARCIPALLTGYEATGQQRYLNAGMNAAHFIMAWRYEDGSFPQVIYSKGRVNRYPQWIAGTADILRILDLMHRFGMEDTNAMPTFDWLLAGQERTGGFRTAKGFASQSDQKEPSGLPDFRDLLPVCGWNDKVLRFLAGVLPDNINLDTHIVEENALQVDCTFHGRRARYFESSEELKLTREENTIYHWRKGTPWPEICEPEMWWL